MLIKISIKKKTVPNTPRDDYGDFDQTPGTPSYRNDDYQNNPGESPQYHPQTPSYESNTPFANPTPSPGGGSTYRTTPSPGYPGPTPVSYFDNLSFFRRTSDMNQK